MPGIDDCLVRAMAIPGAQSATLVDYASGLPIAAIGDDRLMDRDEDAAATTDMVRAVLASPAFAALPAGEDIADIIISSTSGYHILVLIRTIFDSQLFLHLRLDRQRGNIALAQHRIQRIIGELVAP